MSRWSLIPALFLAVTLCASCRKEKVTAPPQPANPTSSRPTAEQLLKGPRQTLGLGALPLNIKVPTGWKIESIARSELLTGPAPTADVQIMCSSRNSVPADQLDSILAAAKTEAQKSGPNVTITQHTTADGIRIFDIRNLPSSATQPAAGNPDAVIDWTLRIYIPNGEKFRAYELNFIGLSLKQYNSDKDYLQSILDSLQIDTSVMQ